ncbi:hypothetical protein [Streptomyces cinnamoneus]|uniref:Uncharacterized protein n=1 Tax=Streptomyces cinnamoneus TaxID=53446 RepID=A0A918WEY4_STRCJ|nr:hypothetical protein [Streptomyces cinnamoneus]GHC40565.1 hypothetical protein GCM10010507_13490 [Streptomyces cinnamoneus]
MSGRELVFGLYADEAGMEWVRNTVRSAAASRGVRVVRWEENGIPEPDARVEDLYEDLAEQWSCEHPGEDPAGRRPVELRIGLACSLRMWRSLRKTVLRRLCPPDGTPHVCRVPWAAM